MKIDISSTLKNSDVEIPINASLDLSAFELPISGCALSSLVEVVGTVKAIHGASYLDVVVSSEYTMSCDRCATEYNLPFEYKFHAMLTDDLAELDSEELVVAPYGTLDLMEVTQTILILFAPTKHLCRDDCKGLCPKCGQDLNHTMCGCDNRKIDPRLAKLAQFFEGE